MKMNDKIYDILKYLGMIFLPALAVAYQSLAEVWSLPFPKEIPNTILIIVTLLNTCLQISSTNYYKGKNDKNNSGVEDLTQGEG